MKIKRDWRLMMSNLIVPLIILNLCMTIPLKSVAVAAEDVKGRMGRIQWMSGDEDEGQGLLPGNLLGDIQVSEPTRSFLDELYKRHSSEFTRIIQDNPQLVWDAMDVVLDALPALKAMPKNGGRLYVDKNIYARASGLVDRCEDLSTPELAKDLKKLRLFVEMRIKEVDSDRIMIDLQN
ncbi:hypothetical protein [Desulforhabdus amnigena]|jgi:hypothetical protein|uniref:Uncharacterized protein n=1 Tax=Desulforhabdus amnigena TaxID=40218 RepID=A0A9W6FW87_9BACT|nr:hypothetical protein [Desulforhabdus amnigena]NLJ29117.1 hypothetical protein [Deltaproteobacteria bacterium]GLI36041.1 hypothetical protein DAMNIGENAA_34740 [Desulforhabdus amnigena]